MTQDPTPGSPFSPPPPPMSGRDAQSGSAGRNPFEQSAPLTQAFPPVYNNHPQAQPMGQQPGLAPFQPGMLPSTGKPRSKLLPIVIGAVVALVLVGGGLVWFFSNYSVSFGGGSDAASASLVAPASEPAAAVSTSAEPKATPPSGARACGSTDAFDVYAATDVTSCPFSESVAAAVGSPRGGATVYSVDAYSSVTGRSYSMNCTEKTNGETRCTGGNNAVVVLIER